ncbi:MAG: acyltransferase family protein [Marinifilaceae bacterium]
MSRNSLLDNAKFLMIFFVVFGHLIEPFIKQNVVFETIYKIIYSFHMPVFIIISGILTKQTPRIGREKKLIQSILVPLIVFTFLYETSDLILKGAPSHYIRSFSPYWILWFLLSLFCWRMVAPFFIKLRYPVLASIIISMIAGYFDSIGCFLSLSRTLYFFPFFLIGFLFTPEIFSHKKLVSIPKVVLVSVLILNILFFILFPDINHRWLYGSCSYTCLGAVGWTASLIRFGFLVLSFISSVAILLLIPNRKMFFSSIGAKSLYICLARFFC